MHTHDIIQKALEMQADAYACDVQDFGRSENLVLRASPDQPFSRMISIDVLPEYRRQGIAVYLVHSLTQTLLEQGVISMYPTWYSNVGSQRAALKAGYLPVWVEIGSETNS